MGPLLFVACLAAAAVPPAGEWRLDSQNTKVKVLAWGLFCGKEPADSRGIPGARYTLTVSGEDFVLKGAGKTFASNGCSMDPPVFKSRLSDRNEGVYRVECEAPPIGGQPQVNEHRFEVGDGTVRYVTKGEKRKTENLEACRFAYETEMRFVLSTQAGPCSTPGPVARLVVGPAAVDAQPGQRICFKVQGMDEHDCAVTAATPSFSVEPAGQAELDANGCLWTPRDVKESLVLAVTVVSGAGRGGAVVRVAGEGAPKESMEQTVARAGGETAKKLISQVTAGDFVIKTPQEEDDEPPVAAPPTGPVEKEGLPPWLYAAGGGALLLLLGGVFVATRGRKGPAGHAPVVAAPPAPPPAPGKGWQCPQCKFEYASAGQCVHDGSTLVKNESAGRQTMFIPEVGGMICPTCGQRYPTRARFCGNDRSPLVPDFKK